MCGDSCPQDSVPDRKTAARNLVSVLTPFLVDEEEMSSLAMNQPPERTPEPTSSSGATSWIGDFSAIQALVPTLIPDKPLFATFHDGEVHDPLGAGSYAFEADIIGPMLLALMDDEGFYGTHGESSMRSTSPIPTRPIVLHAGLQPNNSPHIGTLVVYCYAFLLARRIRDGIQAMIAATGENPPPRVSVEITFVDIAPVKDYGVDICGIQYQRSHRDAPVAMNRHMADYDEVLHLLSLWSDVPFEMAFQSDLFGHRRFSPTSSPTMRLSDVSSPQSMASLPSARPVQSRAVCPHHGPYTICVTKPAEAARLEANTPVRNLLRSMSHLLDTAMHHIRITGADYAGMYQEMFLYRPLAVWSMTTGGLAAGRTPHIVYAPLVVDWSGAKLSKSLYVREGEYDSMKLLGTDAMCSFALLKSRFNGRGSEGLRRVWDEVESWLEDPKKLFRTFSVEYLNTVIMERNAGIHRAN